MQNSGRDLVGDVVSVTRRLEAARENVFRLWAEAEGLVRWIGPQAWSPFAAVDLRVGGAYRMGMVVPQMGEIWTVGQFAEVVPNHRLRFTWHWEGSDEPVTLVTVSWLNRLEKLCQTGM